MPWPITVDYPIVAIPDLHGQRASLERLLARLGQLPEGGVAAASRRLRRPRTRRPGHHPAGPGPRRPSPRRRGGHGRP